MAHKKVWLSGNCPTASRCNSGSKKRALILGGADCLILDIEALGGTEFQGVLACNAAGYVWPGVLDAWVTVHPQNFLTREKWLVERLARGYSYPVKHYTHTKRWPLVPNNTVFTSWDLPGLTNFGSSGLFAVKVALVDLKYDSVLLCGIPMERSPHFDRKEKWTGGPLYRKHWLNLDDNIKEKIRSMSGWTKDTFGGLN